MHTEPICRAEDRGSEDRRLRVDIFCRVIDNFGDIGVCWRLARQFSDEYQWDIRLWVDDLDSFKRLEPTVDTSQTVQHIRGIEVCCWEFSDPYAKGGLPDVLIEAFACDPPDSVTAAFEQAGRHPIWINLEYLSAEEWVDNCHMGVSLRPDGRSKTFFFPGFRPSTGGLLREGDLISQRDAVQQSRQTRSAALERCNLPRLASAMDAGARLVTLFCYPGAPIAEWLAALHHAWCPPTPSPDEAGSAAQPLNAGNPLHGTPSSPQVVIAVAEGVAPGLEALAQPYPGIRIERMPFLSQPHFDVLLWSADLNVVRGEDSFVRAIWAGRPMIWHIYPQPDSVHLDKLEAWLHHNARIIQGTFRTEAQSAWREPSDRDPAQRVSDVIRAFNDTPGMALAHTLTQMLQAPNWPVWVVQAAAISAAQSKMPSLAESLRSFCLGSNQIALEYRVS